MLKNKAAVLHGVKDLKFEEFEIPKPLAYEVVIRNEYVSICTVEQRAYSGARNFGFPFIGGHESSGVVVSVGEGVTGLKEGDKVVATYGYCGHCEFCQKGQGTQCVNSRSNRPRLDFEGTIIGGAFAQYIVVPQWQTVKLADDANLEHSALTEPLACVIHSTRKTRLSFGDTAVIIGFGVMGYFHLKLALLSGARVIVSEPDQARREKALESGAAFAINPLEEDAIAFVKSKTDGHGANVVINTIPLSGVWEDAIDMLAPYGQLVAYSSQDKKDPIGISFSELHDKETEFIGTVSPTIEDNLRASKMIYHKAIDMDEVIQARYTFEQSDEAYQQAIQPNTYRVIVKVQD